MFIKAAHIVPHFLNVGSFGDTYFGSRAGELEKPTNALMLNTTVKSWFDRYQLVIVPVHINASPITRWKVEIISPSIKNHPCSLDSSVDGELLGEDLDRRELHFPNDNRPASRFLYFYLITALVRLRDLEAEGWKDIWAKYFNLAPFQTPGPYLRKTYTLSFCRRFETADGKIIERWIKGHGFEDPIPLTAKEEKYVAKRIQKERRSYQTPKMKTLKTKRCRQKMISRSLYVSLMLIPFFVPFFVLKLVIHRLYGS